MEWIANQFYFDGETDAAIIVDIEGAWAAETPRGKFYAIYYV